MSRQNLYDFVYSCFLELGADIFLDCFMDIYCISDAQKFHCYYGGISCQLVNNGIVNFYCTADL